MSEPLTSATVNLTTRSVRALNNAANWTGDTTTDVINRALQVYEFTEQIKQSGGSIRVRRSEGAEWESVTFE